MIPIQVRMFGWMRYRDEQVADFSDGNLISICGENGAGKSSIFDAITYALYGKHRLGQQATEELITQDSDASWVEFDFEIADKRWRVHRGKSRGSVSRTGRQQPGPTTQALYFWDPQSEQWVRIPGTESASRLQSAIDGIVHLSEPAFTSSFMLQQGAATQFLDAKPAERFKTVSSLIGLAIYEQLADAARKASTRERERTDDIRKQLDPLADIDEETLEQRRRLSEEAQAAAQLANETLAKARTRAADAERFATRLAEIAILQGKIAEARALIAHKSRIEADAKTYEGLAAIIESLQQLQSELSEAAQLESEADQARLEAGTIDIVTLELALAAAQEDARLAAEELKRAESLLSAARTSERAADNFHAVATAVLQARTRLNTKNDECLALCSELTEIGAVKEEAESLSLVVRALQPLTAFGSALGRFEALDKLCPQKMLVDAQQGLESLRLVAGQLEDQHQVREKAFSRAQQEHAVGSASLNGWREQLRNREAAADEAICSRCGQPVSPEQARAEIGELTAKVTAAKAAVESLRQAETDAAAKLDAVKAEAAKNQDAASQLDSQVARLDLDVRSLAAARLEVDERRTAFVALAPAELLKAVEGQDAAGVAAVTKGLAGAHRREQAASRRYQTLLGVQGQLDAVGRELQAARAALVEAEAGAGECLDDIETAEVAWTESKAVLNRSERSFAAARTRVSDAEQRRVSAEQALRTGMESRSALTETESRKRIEATGHRNTADALARALPRTRQRTALSDPAGVLLKAEQTREELQEAPLRLLELRTAEQNCASWEGEQQAKESEIASIPDEHRVPVGEASADLQGASLAAEQAAEDREGAATTFATMVERLRQKKALEQQQDTAERRQQRYAKLSRLLGKGGLQGALVTDALSTITSHANSFLQRLTSGSLRLTLKKGSGADELDLQAIDATCMREARSVQALSGSQKFRCAVAVAFGIGQYAGAGGMRSMVIDEGFGALDDMGQQQMVDELKTLAGYMDKVIVVSHLDVFRDLGHFPFQIYVEKLASTSVLRRVS